MVRGVRAAGLEDALHFQMGMSESEKSEIVQTLQRDVWQLSNKA